ncbi:hypothetical protein [Paraburkholderia sediminicola]|uniref:hypothetical protein n=1 Tax=Paraburkholderia sediminicola TaxID=458836 RepID=UPI0038B71289
MTTIESVEFEATPPQREQLNGWLKREGARLDPTEIDPYATTTTYEDQTEKKRYKAQLLTDFRLRAPDWVLDLIVKP